MKILAMLVNVFLLTGCTTAPLGYVFSDESSADIKLVVTVSLDGAFKNRKAVFWMRAHPGDRGTIYLPQSWSQYADGVSADGKRGIGYGIAVDAQAEQDQVIITLTANWDLENGSGKRAMIGRIPYFSATRSDEGPLKYSAVWERKPNQPLQRNAGSRPSSDDSPVSETPSSPGPRG